MSENRTEKYAKQLSRLIAHETVSSRTDLDLSKFYAFHELLREQFPSLFSVCEIEDFSGSFLMRNAARVT